MLGVTERKAAPTPAIKTKKENHEDLEELVNTDNEFYKSVVGILAALHCT